jgi:hypothetical protein
MKTVTYQQIQDQAGEMSGRPVGKLPLSEANILLMLFTAELKVMWNSQAWPDLCDNLAAQTVVNTGGLLTISKNEGAANEIGDVLWIGTSDPRNPTGPVACNVRFEIGNGQIYILNTVGSQSTLWVDYQLPPPDLLAVSLSPTTALPVLGFLGGVKTLPNLLLPQRFYLPLAAIGAARLLKIDGLMPQASAMESISQSNLDWASAQPEMKMPRWRGVRLR